MKNLKKLSILLLSVLMAFSCLAVLSFAQEEDAEAKKIAAVKALLEYYDEEGIYICDPFDGKADASLEMNPDSEGAYTVVDGKDVWSATLDGNNVLCSEDIALPPSYESIGLLYSFRVDAAEENEEKGYLAIEFSGASTTAAQADAQVVFVLDYKEAKAYFAVMDANRVVSSYEISGFVPENGVWYKVSMVYDKEANTFEGNIKAEGGSAVSFTYGLSDISSVSTIALRNRNLGNKGVTVSWDSFELYEGSFIRSNLAGERQKYLDAAVAAYMQEYDTASNALRNAIASTLNSLLELGYTPAPGSDATEELDRYIAEYYWVRFAEGVAAIDKQQKYKDRYDALIAIKAIGADFPEKPQGYPKELYDAAIAAYEEELEALTLIEETSKALLKAVEQDTETMDYQQLLAWVLDFEDKKENLLRADGSYDDTYFGVSVAIDFYQVAVDRLYSLKALALDYINAVDAMNRNYPTDFGVKFAAFTRARTIASDPRFVYIENSYVESLCFLDENTVLYNNREFPILSYTENGKSAVISINSQPYTLTLRDHRLMLVGEGLTIVFKPADANSGLALSGNWECAKTLAEAMVDFDNRDDFIIAGEALCKEYISAVDMAVVSTGYARRIQKRDGVKAAYDSQRAVFEEGGAYYGYEGLAEAVAAFDAFCAQIEADAEDTDAYIALVIELKNLDPARNYREIKAIIDLATPYYNHLLDCDVADYANEITSKNEADKLYTQNKDVVLLAEDNAAKFKAEVQNASSAVALSERLSSLRAAQKLLNAKIGNTAVVAHVFYGSMDGMDAEISAFEAEKDRYLADAQTMNAVAEQEGVKLVRIAFANLKVSTTEKIAFIVKKVYEL